MPTPLIYPPTQDALQKTLDASLLTGVTASATLNNVTGIQNLKGLMVIDRVDGNNNLTPTKREYISFTGTSGSTVVTLTRGLAGSTDQDHALGAIVEFVNDVVQQQAILDGLGLIVGADGTLTGSAIDTDGTLSANSDSKLATQKAVKTYVGTPPVKATGAEVTTGTDDAKFATPKALADADVNTRLKSKVITLTRDLTTATGNVAYTGVGFTPTSIVAFGVVDGTAFVSNGFSDSAKTSQCMYQYGSNTWSMSAGLLAMSPTISAYQIATVASYDADGFTLTWTKTSTPTGTATVRVICYR